MSEPSVLRVDGRGWPHPWPGVFELAGAVSSDHWVLIGGLMVQLHHRLNGQEPTRVTSDIDTLARVEVTWREHVNALLSGLKALGYEEKRSIDTAAPLHRLTRSDEQGKVQVDFLIADHVPPPASHDLPRPAPVQAPGGRNALARLLLVDVTVTSGTVRIAVPDLIGALELKIEAYGVDSRDRERHLHDAVALAGLLDEDAPEPPLHGSAAHRLRRLLSVLDDAERTTRAGLNRDAVIDAALALEGLLTHDG